MGYGIAVFPPGHYSPGEDVYIATHNLIKAHAKAYRTYEHDHKNKGGNGIKKYVLRMYYNFYLLGWIIDHKRVNCTNVVVFLII